MNLKEKYTECLRKIELLEKEKLELERKIKEEVKFFTVKNWGLRDMLVIKLDEKVRNTLTLASGNDCPYIAIKPDGGWGWGFYVGNTFKDVKSLFGEKIEPLFKE